jgi:hypothetical protein
VSHATTSTRASGGRRSALAGVALLAVVVAGCTAQAAPSVAPTPRPTPTPAPTATPMPGTPLPETYRPEGDWTVTFALPGDFITETWRIVLTCPKGSCDAIVEMRDARGKGRGRAELALQDGRYVMRTTTTATVDCTAAGAKVEGGATRRTETDVVLATYRLAGTAIDQRTIQGRRTVTLEPQSGSGCAPSTLVYPASGEPAAE